MKQLKNSKKIDDVQVPTFHSVHSIIFTCHQGGNVWCSMEMLQLTAFCGQSLFQNISRRR